VEGLSFLISKIGPALRWCKESAEETVEAFFDGLDTIMDKLSDGLDAGFDAFDSVVEKIEDAVDYVLTKLGF
jgi:iron uptake system EfeUOB component EfeO/EfeM